MSRWPSIKAGRVIAALARIGWREVRRESSHRTLRRDGWPDYTFSFADGDEIGPAMMSKIAKKTGLSPQDL